MNSLPYNIKPWWRYYGGKYRAAPHYPKPNHDIIIEPFAGAAGYATRYYDRQVILIEKYPVIVKMWEFLIESSKDDILSIPLVESLDELPSWVPEGARHLVGFSFNDATVSPANRLSKGRIKLREMGRNFEGWNVNKRQRIADQVDLINHWVIIEGDYTNAPDIPATWFIDPPYNNKAGSMYKHSDIDYDKLADWCLTREGQIIVCENEGADWLPFQEFRTFKAGITGSGNSKGSKEVIFYIEDL